MARIRGTKSNTLSMPNLGVDQAWPYGQQGQLTTPDALNVWVRDRGDRMRLSPRPGLSKISATPIGVSANTDIQQMLHLRSQVSGTLKDYLVAVCDGDVYLKDSLALPTICTGGTNAVSTSVKPSMAYGHQAGACLVFMVDGTNFKVLTVSTSTVASHAATAGSLPTSPSLCCMWRNRLCVVSGQNLWMSRVGCYGDFDYTASDDARAVELNASLAGKIGKPINCLIPWRDDYLLIGTDESVYTLAGDPATGGQLNENYDFGTMGPECWCSGPGAALYIVGTTGLYRCSVGGSFQSIGDRYPTYFNGFSVSSHHITLAFDRRYDGVWIFRTSKTTGASTHVFLDSRTGGLWPMSFPNSHGPTSAVVWDGLAADDREILLGGRDGIIRKLDATVASDDGTAIDAWSWLGPLQTSGVCNRTLLNGLHVILGEVPSGFGGTNFAATLTAHVGSAPREALDASACRTWSLTRAGRQERLGFRQRENAHVLKISNGKAAGKLFSLDQVGIEELSEAGNV